MDGNFTKIKNELIISKIKDSKFRILCYLIAHSKNGRCFPSIRTIAKDLGKNKDTIQEILKELVEDGSLQKENRFLGTGKKTSNCYIINEKYLTSKKVAQEETPEKIELFDYNWLEDEE